MKRWHGWMWTIVCVLAGTAVALAQIRDLPAGWTRAGNKPSDYDIGVDAAGGRSGGAAFIKAKTPATDGFGTVMQTFAADDYRGKRLKMSAYVKAAGITTWAGLWLRIDGNRGAPLAFDNMQNRPINGTKDWTRYEVVLDVPNEAQAIAFGLLLTGPGQAWLDDIQFDVVGLDVSTTGVPLH